ncbi:PREDICTED: (-)-germacrene D synthase [Prunus dulcis]|uniref:PREDICTED: (-)-germacrene D synthase n=1 Tax=Prunus dulcis TaxID=3755 RepID=A0A5E4FYD2_PRUDU|nr:PREDICTED: (-)-germacrene D synthase [Prunus dulcis]
MSFPVAAQVAQSAEPEIVRQTANYHPSIWGDRFLNYDEKSIQITYDHMQQQVDQLKVTVRKEVFTTSAGDFSHQLKLIDAVQRLGVAYHFEREIEEALQRVHVTYHDYDGGDLYAVALGFRLLRQHGFNVSCDIFNKFKDKNGNFKESLTADVPGMLSFYEAAHLRKHGEDILEEALVFTTTHLESAETTEARNPLALQITQALERPLRKGLERVCARGYMSIYQDDASHSEAILKLAKLDFNIVQSLHKKELSEITRWDINCMDELPDYMQVFYHTLLNVYDEIEEEMVKEGRSYRVYYAKEAVKAQARNYFAEAQWLHKDYIPSMEEYMSVATACVGNTLLSITSLVGMGDIVTKEAFEWLLNDPRILRASNIIFRLMDDLSGYEFEKEREHVASSIECYMKQYGVPEQEVLDIFNKQVKDLWKDINEEFLRPTDVPMPVLMRVLNLTRVVDLLYKGEDGYTHVGKVMKDSVASLFIEPVPL